MNVPDVTDVSNIEQVARHLLEAKANIEAVNNEGVTSLMKAAQNGHAEVVRLLLAPPGSADADKAANNGLTPLVMAAFKNRGAAAEALLAGGATKGLRTPFGTAAEAAAGQGHAALAQRLR